MLLLPIWRVLQTASAKQTRLRQRSYRGSHKSYVNSTANCTKGGQDGDFGVCRPCALVPFPNHSGPFGIPRVFEPFRGINSVKNRTYYGAAKGEGEATQRFISQSALFSAILGLPSMGPTARLVLPCRNPPDQVGNVTRSQRGPVRRRNLDRYLVEWWRFYPRCFCRFRS